MVFQINNEFLNQARKEILPSRASLDVLLMERFLLCWIRHTPVNSDPRIRIELVLGSYTPSLSKHVYRNTGNADLMGLRTSKRVRIRPPTNPNPTSVGAIQLGHPQWSHVVGVCFSFPSLGTPVPGLIPVIPVYRVRICYWTSRSEA